MHMLIIQIKCLKASYTTKFIVAANRAQRGFCIKHIHIIFGANITVRLAPDLTSF